MSVRRPSAPALITLADLGRRLTTDTPAIVEIARDVGPTLPPAVLRLTLADLSGQERPDTGTRPLPDHSAIISLLSSVGITPRTWVVLVRRDVRDLAAAARAWVVLRWAGLQNTSVLNDGLADDLAGAFVGEPPAAEEKALPFVIDPDRVIDIAGVSARDAARPLVDAREASAFGGPGDHIPGSVNIPSRLLIGAEGGIVAPERVRAAYASAQLEPHGEIPVLSCGSGVAASVHALALASIGVTAPVYIGSWSEWSKTQRTGVTIN